MKHLGLILSSALAMAAMFQSSAQDIPAYYHENGYIESRVKAIPKGKSFIFITDIHTQRNAGCPTALPAWVAGHSRIGMTIFGGDCFDWAPDKAKAEEYVSTTFGEFEKGFGRRFLWVQGNHDCNSNAVSKYKIPVEVAEVPDVDTYRLTVERMEDRIIQDEAIVSRIKALGLSPEYEEQALAWAKMHYWYDDVKARIRYIVLETEDGGPSTKRILPKGKFSEWQDEFLKETLKTVPKGYDVVIAGHMFFNNPSGPLRRPWFQTALNYRLSSKGRVLLICGHAHVDNALAFRMGGDGKLVFEELESGSTVPSDAALMVVVSCDANASYQKYAQNSKCRMCKAHYPMKKGTTAEHCFDVVTFTKKGLAFTRIGAGADRVYKY